MLPTIKRLFLGLVLILPRRRFCWFLTGEAARRRRAFRNKPEVGDSTFLEYVNLADSEESRKESWNGLRDLV